MSVKAIMNFANASASNASVFVGGIPGNITAEDVKSYFSAFGQVSEVNIPSKKENPLLNNGYCFVRFSSNTTADYVISLRDHYIGKRRVTCKSFLAGNHLSSEISSSNDRKLFVKFIPAWVTEQIFKEYFEQFGDLESYYMVKYKDPKVQETKNTSSVGYLVYKDQSLIAKMVEKKYFKMGSKKVLVEKYDRNYTKTSKADNTCVSSLQAAENNHPCYSVRPTQAAYFKNRIGDFVGESLEDSINYRFNFNQDAPNFRSSVSSFDKRRLNYNPFHMAKRESDIRTCSKLICDTLTSHISDSSSQSFDGNLKYRRRCEN